VLSEGVDGVEGLLVDGDNERELGGWRLCGSWCGDLGGAERDVYGLTWRARDGQVVWDGGVEVEG
jgi:hypothetical protein